MDKISKGWKLLGLVAILFVALSCQKQDDAELMNNSAKSAPAQKAMLNSSVQLCGTPTIVMLTAGQHIDAGAVTVGNDANYLYVTYSATNGYLIKETHLYIGSKNGVPVNKSGNPQIGHFPYGESFAAPVGEVTYQFNLADFEDCFIVAAHAVVVKYDGDVLVDEQTAWGAGNPFVAKGSWAMYFEYCKQTCTDDPDPVYFNETAFAYGYDYATCFLDWGFNRWGWSNAIVEGDYTFEIWAAAGQCDLSKGIMVGNLIVNYTEGMATVTYSMLDGFTMLENHLYVGANRLPLKNGVETVAPGQYPIVVGNLSATNTTYTVNNLSGPIFVVAHATVEWYTNGGSY